MAHQPACMLVAIVLALGHERVRRFADLVLPVALIDRYPNGPPPGPQAPTS
jgi:hypothetical protein